MKFKYSVGDKVLVHDSAEGRYSKSENNFARVIKTEHRGNGQAWYNYRVQWPSGTKAWCRARDIEKYVTIAERSRRDCVEGSSCNDGSCAVTQEERVTPMASIVERVRRLAQPKDERLLRDYGVVNECGELTAVGEGLLIEILFAANREAIVEKVKALDEEEKKSRKSK